MSGIPAALTRLILTILFCSLCGRVHAAKTPAQPDILFVIADQWQAQAFGYAGDPNARTPHLDHFESEATDFHHARSAFPCSRD